MELGGTDALVGGLRVADAGGGLQHELDTQDAGSHRKSGVGGHDLHFLTEEVVDILERAVSQIEGMTTEAVAVCEQDPGCLRRADLDAGGDFERAAPDVDRDRFGHLDGVRIVDKPVSGPGDPRSGGVDDGVRAAVIQRQRFVLTGFDVPQHLEFLDQVRMLRTEIVAL